MRALLHSELLKLSTTRTFAALTGAAVALSLLVVGLSAGLTDDFTDKEARDLFAANFTGLFILLLGVMGLAGEFRHRTISGTVLAAPDRVRLVAAKVIAYAAAGVVVSLVVTVASMVVGWLILTIGNKNTADTADLIDVLWRNLASAALLGAFGVCVGGLIRNQVTAIVSLLVLGFIAEPTLVALVPEVGHFGPTAAAPSAIVEAGTIEDDLLQPGIAVLVLGGWIALTFAAAAALLRTRDLVE